MIVELRCSFWFQFMEDWLKVDLANNSYCTFAAKTCPGFVTSGATMTPELPEYEHGNKVTVHCELGKILNSDAVSSVLNCSALF